MLPVLCYLFVNNNIVWLTCQKTKASTRLVWGYRLSLSRWKREWGSTCLHIECCFWLVGNRSRRGRQGGEESVFHVWVVAVLFILHLSAPRRKIFVRRYRSDCVAVCQPFRVRVPSYVKSSFSFHVLDWDFRCRTQCRRWISGHLHLGNLFWL